MQVKRLGHVAIKVENVERAAEFYQNLGLELAWKDSDWAYLKAGQGGLALLGPGYAQAGPHFGFVFDNRAAIDEAFERLSQTDIKLTPVHEHRDGTASFYGRDLDGNWFEYLYEPAAQAAAQPTAVH
jgi:catechol 2,3-dioxygenase-like lactoylglutathione lyase family enzyme